MIAYARVSEGVADVLCIDDLPDGGEEAWAVRVAEAELRERERMFEHGEIGSVTEDMLAEYDSEFFDGPGGLARLAALMAGGGGWRPLCCGCNSER